MSSTMTLNKLVTGVIVTAFLVNRGLRLKSMLTVYPEMKFNDQNCQIKGSMTGPEDLCLGKNSLMFIGETGGLDTLLNHGSAAAESGGIWMLDMRDAEAEPVKLQIQGYPEQPLHVHGIYVSNKTDQLYAVNHQGPLSTVEVFKIDYSTAVKLTYLQTVRSDFFPRYGINDVIEGIDGNEVYVTKWSPVSIPEHGKLNPAPMHETIMNNVVFPIIALLGLHLTKVYRCDLRKNACEEATDRLFVGANGITKNLDGSIYYVVDLSEKKIGIMKREANGWLEFESWIEIPFSIDNIEFDHDSGSLMMGTMPDLFSAIRKLDGEDIAVPGGLSLAFQENGEWKTKDIVMHDGTKLCQVSGANMFGDTAVISSPVAKGVLVCKI